MNKLIGYCTIEVPTETGSEIIEIKMGAFAIERACEVWGIGLSEIDTLYEMQDRGGKLVPVARKPYDFAAAILWAGANYAAMIQDKPTYKIMDAYQWLDALRLDSKQLLPVYAAFGDSLFGPDRYQDKKKDTSPQAGPES